MTTEEKSMRLNEICESHPSCDGCPIQDNNGKCPIANYREEEEKAVIDAVYNRVFRDADPTPRIKDSGERREFATGAVRDIQEGKGRCDLMPLDVIARVLNDNALIKIHSFQRSGGVDYLYDVLKYTKVSFPCQYTMFLEVAKHFEAGAQKYGEYNWQKGIPVKCYIDSAVRHYLKWLRGDNDEPHDRAFVWNILCCIWTCEQMPELNDYAKEKEHD